MTNPYGVTLYAKISVVNNAAIEGAASASSAGTTLVDPNWIPVLSINPAGVLSWNSVAGKNYQLWSTTNLPAAFAPFGSSINAIGANTSLTNPPTGAARYFKVQLLLL